MPAARSQVACDRSRRACIARLGAGVALGFAWSATARGQAPGRAPAEVASELAAPRLQGEGRLTFFGLPVYAARLWVEDGFRPEAATTLPLALELVYARSLHGEKIAERSLHEMRRQGAIDPARAEAWLGGMRQVFVDVHAGDRMTGVHRPGEAARFFHNGVLRGELRDALFARAFFAIWLDPATSEPAMRRTLLGPSA